MEPTTIKELQAALAGDNAARRQIIRITNKLMTSKFVKEYIDDTIDPPPSVTLDMAKGPWSAHYLKAVDLDVVYEIAVCIPKNGTKKDYVYKYEFFSIRNKVLGSLAPDANPSAIIRSEGLKSSDFSRNYSDPIRRDMMYNAHLRNKLNNRRAITVLDAVASYMADKLKKGRSTK
jgi:hypothetical protein